MATELFANNFAVQLAAGCAPTDTTITTNGPAPTALQAAGQFRILIDQEYMLVTGGASGTSWAVSRGAATGESPTPTAVSHGRGAWVTHLITAAALGNLPGGGGGSTTLAGLTDVSITSPSAGQGLVYNSATSKWNNGAATAENVNTVAASGSGTVTIPDPWSSTFQTISDVTLTGTPTFAFPTAAAGKSFTIILRQDGTGSRTVTWPTVTWLAGNAPPVLSTAVNAVDIATFVCTDGTHWLGAFTPGYSSTPASPELQNGVYLSTDLALSSISINTGTSALTFTPASTGTQSAWVQNSSGVLVPVGYSAGAKTLTPGAITSGQYAVVGVEIDTTGTISLVTGSSTATQLNTGILIASHSPATSSGKMRIADFAVWNNAGTYNFGDHTTTPSQGVNWIDRRPWARGFRSRYDRTAGNYTTTSTSIVAIDSTNLSVRAECTGVPVKIKLIGLTMEYTAASYIVITLYEDGVATNNTDFTFDTASTFMAPAIEFEVTPGAGSHLFQLYWTLASAGTGTIFGTSAPTASFIVEEVVRQNATNGNA